MSGRPHVVAVDLGGRRLLLLRRQAPGFGTLMRDLIPTGGVAPARAYIEELMPHIPEGRIDPAGPHRTLDEVPDGYRAMADRQALKVLIRP